MQGDLHGISNNVCGSKKKVTEKTVASVKFHLPDTVKGFCVYKYANIVACKSLDVPETEDKLYLFVCSAMLSECITQRWECKSGDCIQANLSHSRMQIGKKFSEVIHGRHHKKRCQE